MEAQITEHYVKYETNKYFRGNAHNVEMGSYGEKKDPVGAKAYLDVQAKVQSKHLDDRVKFKTVIDIDWNQTSKAELEAGGPVKFFGLDAEAGANATYEKAKSARLKLLNLAINEGPLTVMLNQDADGARNFLADEGKDGRIVSEIWVLAEGELTEHFSTSASISVGAADSKGLEVTATGGKAGSRTIRIGPGATFAYKLHKVKDWNKGKTQIENMEADWKGLG